MSMDGYIVDLIILSFTYLTIYVYFNESIWKQDAI